MAKLVEKIYDTRLIANDETDWHDFGGAAFIEDGFLIGYHVTDDPQGLIDKLRRGFDVASHGSPWEDLGKGLYISAVPDYWAGRASKKWAFLDRLTRPQLERLAKALLKSQAFEENYTTKSEQEHAAGLIELTLSGKYNPSVLIMLADQPYNVSFWKPSFLEPLGIEPGHQPKTVEVKSVGLFARLGKIPSPDEAAELQKEFDGVFTPSGFSTSAQTVIFNRKAIMSAQEVHGLIRNNPPRRRRR
jgi:hypothetical protein